MQDLEAGPAALERVHRVLPGARLDERALHELLVHGAPHAHLDAVLALEGADQRMRILERHRRVQDEGTFFLRLREKPRVPVSAPVEVDRAVRLRMHGARRRQEKHDEPPVRPPCHCFARSMTVRLSNSVSASSLMRTSALRRSSFSFAAVERASAAFVCAFRWARSRA